MKRIQDFNMIQKISIGIVLVVSLITLLNGGITLKGFFDLQRGGVEKRLTSSLNSLGWRLQDNDWNAEQIANGMQTQMDLPYYFNPQNQISLWQIEDYRERYLDLLNHTNNIHGAMLLSINMYSANHNMQFSDLAHYSLPSIMERQFPPYQRVAKGNHFYASPYLHEDLQRMVLPYYQEIYDISTNSLVGIMELEMDIEEVVNEQVELDNQVMQIIFDANRNVVCSTYEIEEELLSAITERLQGNAGKETFSLSGKEFMFLYEQQEQMNLFYAVLQTTDVGEAFLIEGLHIHFLMLFCMLFLLLWISYSILRKKLKPLVILGQAIDAENDMSMEVLVQDVSKSKSEVSNIIRHFQRMTLKLQGLERDNEVSETARQHAELRALHAQINPHFLYNTLENMRMKCEIDQYYDLGDRLAILSDLFRYSVDWKDRMTTLKNEFNNLENYIFIMEMRFEDALEYELHCDSSVSEVTVPKLILQPLVENCFKHGFCDLDAPWRVQVLAERVGAYVQIVVRDNGKGIATTRLRELEKSNGRETKAIGVDNVKQRIRGMCPADSDMTIRSQAHQGTEVVIRIFVG